MRHELVSVGGQAVWKSYVVKNCSCEGIAEHLFGIFNSRVQEESAGRVFLIAVEVVEDSKNSATYSASPDVIETPARTDAMRH